VVGTEIFSQFSRMKMSPKESCYENPSVHRFSCFMVKIQALKLTSPMVHILVLKSLPETLWPVTDLSNYALKERAIQNVLLISSVLLQLQRTCTNHSSQDGVLFS